MPDPERRTRTYVAFTCRWSCQPDRPLGTVEAPSIALARTAARRRWPAAGAALRVRTAAAVSADVLGRALALDAAADGRPAPRARGGRRRA
jgi:hypothetical protein